MADCRQRGRNFKKQQEKKNNQVKRAFSWKTCFHFLKRGVRLSGRLYLEVEALFVLVSDVVRVDVDLHYQPGLTVSAPVLTSA